MTRLPITKALFALSVCSYNIAIVGKVLTVRQNEVVHGDYDFV